MRATTSDGRVVERRSRKSRVIRAVKRIMHNDSGMSIEELTALGLFVVALRTMKN